MGKFVWGFFESKVPIDEIDPARELEKKRFGVIIYQSIPCSC